MKIFIPKKIFLIGTFFLFSIQIVAQVGIGTTAPDASSMLHITDTEGSKGILIPSIALTATNVAMPVTPAPAVSLLIYNTAAAGTGTTAVVPGYYYWDGTQWIPLTTQKDNIYVNDGLLTDNRVVSQNAYSLDFSGTTGRHLIGIKRTDNTLETGISFKNSGNWFDAAVYMEASTSSGLVIASGGNHVNAADVVPTAIFNDDTTTSFSKAISLYENTANTGAITSSLYASGSNGILDLNENNSYNHRIHANGTTEFNAKQYPLDFKISTDTHAHTLFVKGSTDRVGIKTNTPQRELHIAGNTATARVEGLSNANNAYNVPEDPAPVYVDNNGDLSLQPPLIQTFMPINLVDFFPTTDITSTTGAGVTATLYTTTLTLTQESLVHINYQYSVQITRANGTALTDGASRLFRGGVLVNSDPVHIGYSTGTYTNNPDVDATNSVYASGYYYLSGNGYVQLPAGTHTFTLDVLGFAASYDYRMRLGETNQDRFQVVVHR